MDICFTYRPGINNHFGAGIYGPRDICGESSHMGSLSAVFSAGVLAILRSCAELAFGQEYYDDDESMDLLWWQGGYCGTRKTVTELAVVWDGPKVTFCWHLDIRG
jgi:hypothetical protein